MDSLAPARDVARAMAIVQTIDLTNVMRRLRRSEGWTEAQATTAEQRYRRFLCMHHLGVDFDLVPAADIDKVWHQHILHTRDYAGDCQRVFGTFLHHLPAREDDDTAPHSSDDGFARTKTLYAELFGEDYVETWLTYFLR